MRKSSSSASIDSRRRILFAGAGTAGALAVAASVFSRGSDAADSAASVKDDALAQADGYRLTPHVQRYYQTAKV